MLTRRFGPETHKKQLILLAGLLWLAVGAGLTRLAETWLSAYGGGDRPLHYGAGFLAALLIHHLGFLKIADRNLERLLPLEEKRSVFSFIPARSYLLIAGMMALGYALRHSPVPKHYLSVVYIAVGLALVLSSVRYFRYYLKLAAGGRR